MGTARGYKSQVVLDFEDTFGADPAAAAGLIMPVNSCAVKAERGKNPRNLIRGHRNPAMPFDGNTSVGGDIVVPVDSAAFAWWLKAMFGSPSTAGAGPYTHTFTVGDEMPSFLLDQKFADASAAIAYAKENGCKVASFALSVGSDNAELTGRMTVAGASETVGAAAYDAAATEVSVAPFEQFHAALTEGGAALAIATAFELQLDFGLDLDKYCIGAGGVRGDIPEGMIRVSGSITTLFQDRTLLNKAIDSTESTLVLTFTNGTDILSWSINELKYALGTPGIEGPQGILVTLPFEGYYDNHADASAITVALTNNDDGASY